MTEKCANCGKRITITRLKHDENNLDGFYINCPYCGASFDIDERKILRKIFINDIAKMADFKMLTEEEFLESYSYLTEDDYEATRLYFNWLMTDDSEP